VRTCRGCPSDGLAVAGAGGAQRATIHTQVDVELGDARTTLHPAQVFTLVGRSRVDVGQADLRKRQTFGLQEIARTIGDIGEGPASALGAHTLDARGVGAVEHLMQGVLSLFTPRGGGATGAVVESQKFERSKPHVVVQIVERGRGVLIVDHARLSRSEWVKEGLGRWCPCPSRWAPCRSCWCPRRW